MKRQKKKKKKKKERKKCGMWDSPPYRLMKMLFVIDEAQGYYTTDRNRYGIVHLYLLTIIQFC